MVELGFKPNLNPNPESPHWRCWLLLVGFLRNQTLSSVCRSFFKGMESRGVGEGKRRAEGELELQCSLRGGLSWPLGMLGRSSKLLCPHVGHSLIWAALLGVTLPAGADSGVYLPAALLVAGEEPFINEGGSGGHHSLQPSGVIL